MKIYQLAGRCAYALLYPLIVFFVNRTTRTRIIVRSDSDILVIKGWLGNGTWSLPGGGLGRHETAIDGALRELHEEMGLTASSDQLKLLFDDTVRYTKLMAFRTIVYEWRVPSRPEIALKKQEVNEAAWLNIDKARAVPGLQSILQKAYPAR